MAILQSPIVPTRLHRYRAFTRGPQAIDEEIDSILQRYIYCANFLRMNDPMEGYYRSSALLRKHEKYKEIRREITDSKSQIGFACFSERADNVLMWAHYAGNNSGICISYAGSALEKGFSKNEKLVRVAYVDEAPLFYLSHAEDAKNAAIRSLSQKRHDWAYEREWRVMAAEGRVDIGRKSAIKRVTFGLRTDDAHKAKIIAALEGTGIAIHAMRVAKFGLISEPVDEPIRKAKATTKKPTKTKKAKRKKSS